MHAEHIELCYECMFIMKDSERNNSTGNSMNGTPPWSKDQDWLSTIRAVTVWRPWKYLSFTSDILSSVTVSWRPLKCLGLTPGSTTCQSFPLPFQRSLDSNGPDCFIFDDQYQSLYHGEVPSIELPMAWFRSLSVVINNYHSANKTLFSCMFTLMPYC